jgi:hypothetical protein
MPPFGALDQAPGSMAPYRHSNEKETFMNKMHKTAVLLVLVVTVLGPAFAEGPAVQLGTGGGGIFMTDMGESTIGDLSSSPLFKDFQNFNEVFGGGAFAFFDATFAELTIGFHGGSRTSRAEYTYKFSGKSVISLIYLPVYPVMDLGLWGKYPFQVGGTTLFPLLGINYSGGYCVLLETGEKYFNNVLWFMAGGGADFPLSPKLFLRAEALYGLHLLSNVIQKYSERQTDKLGGNWEKYTPGHGLQIRVGVGYRL